MLSNRELAESHLAQSILYLRRERTDSADALAEELQPYVKRITTLEFGKCGCKDCSAATKQVNQSMCPACRSIYRQAEIAKGDKWQQPVGA
jgi:uncharacterized paraquat-inducible protein A